MKTRLLSLFLALGMMLTFLPAHTVTVFATASSETYTDGPYQFTINTDGTATIIGYTGPGSKVAIPDHVTQGTQSYPVTKIGTDAFLSCENLETITIPEGITSIGDYAFYLCHNLNTVTLPSSVTIIGNHAFRDTGLMEIHIPASVTKIGADAFTECPFLKTITSNSMNFPVIENILYEKASDGDYTLLRYPSRRSDSTFEVSNAVTKIGNGAFDHCYSLTSVKIPNSVVSIGCWAFMNCIRLQDIELPNNIKELPESAFENCTSLGNIVIPSSVTIISPWAFSSCNNLETVEYSGTRSQWDNLKSKNSIGYELANATITYGAIDITVNSGNRTVTAKVDGNSVPIIDNAFTAKVGKTVELTVTNPQYRDIYTWTDSSSTVRTDNQTYTFVAGSDDTTVTLTTVEHTTYDAGDFIITGLMDYTYGDEIDIKIESKDASVANYIVKYIQDAGTLDEKEFEELPQDAGIYTLRIIQGDTVIDIPEKFIIQPAAVTNETLQDEFTLILPEGAVESDGIDYAAKITVNSDSRLKALLQSAEVKIELIYIDDAGEEVSTPTKAGRYTVKAKITSSTPNLASTVVDGGSFEIYQKAAPIAPAASLYPLTIKNADVVIKYSGDEIQTEKNEVGDQVARVPENADVTITYTSQSDAIVFDQWVASGLGDSVDVSQNPLTFQMPANEKGVTVEAMTKDASIEDGGSSILGTVVVVGTAAVLAWQGCRIGTELYLKNILPDGTMIPTNITELAELVWNDAGEPVLAAVLNADATDAQKALVWAAENQLLPSGKTADASVNRFEVIQSWRKAQELKG